MRSPAWRTGLVLCLLLSFAACSESGAGDSRASALPAGSGFDFYVLALSWSPSYCAVEGKGANSQQCGGARPYGFIVHGLWPQFERGYPADCATDRPLDVPRDAMRELYDIMPSAGLIRHQWRKHGTCSGLSREDYFATLRAARERVKIPPDYRRLEDYRTVDPDDVERGFIAANPGLDPAGIAVTCDRRFLREVRICMTTSLKFRTCPEVDRRACSRRRSVMPPARGG
ncbi:MAG: ribonuclease [Rhizobiaceae bacterium]